jgi:hypothetical protein
MKSMKAVSYSPDYQIMGSNQFTERLLIVDVQWDGGDVLWELSSELLRGSERAARCSRPRGR